MIWDKGRAWFASRSGMTRCLMVAVLFAALGVTVALVTSGCELAWLLLRR